MLEFARDAVLFLAHAAAVAAILTSERRQPSATLAWLLAVIFLPGIGLLAWLLIGRTRSRRVMRSAAASEERVRQVLDRYEVHRKLEGGARELDPRVDGLTRLGNRLATLPASTGNRVALLVNAAATYRAMIHAVEAARDHVHVEFYIIQPDATGVALRDRLTRRAREGITVRVLCDAIGSSALPDDFWAPLVAAGGEAAFFQPVRRILARIRRRDRVDFRNHRKIVIVDGHTGFTGGINIGREYLGLDPEMGQWRDTHVRIEGPAVLSLQRAFAQDWFTATERLLDDARFFPEPEAAGDCVVQIVDSGPDRAWSPIGLVYAQSIALARERLWITSPYFVPSTTIEDGLVTAALGGVDVRLLLPRRSDNLLVGMAARSYYRQLLEAGVRIFLYQRGFVHAKTMVVDDWVGTVGSANMDMRSFNLNFELNAFVYEPRFVRELAELFMQDQRHATEYALADERRLRAPARLLRAGARLFSPIL